jgi:hypothetical protein
MSSKKSSQIRPEKSWLDAEAFRAYQEAWLRSQGKRGVLVT